MFICQRMTMVILSSILFFILSACGGGSSDEPAKTAPPAPKIIYTDYTITAIDGYLENATAWLDVNNTGSYSSTHPTSQTHGNGEAILSIPDTLIATNFPVIVEAKPLITFDKGLNRLVTNSFTLAAPAGERVVTPFSTLVYIKMKSGLSQDAAISDIANELQISNVELLTDFIANNNQRMTLIAADMVRLNIFPETPTQLVEVTVNPLNISTEVTQYANIQSDTSSFKAVVRNSSNIIELDTDNDGIADGEDGDIDGDDIPNEQDPYPYIIDRHTERKPSELLLGQIKTETLLAGQWHYFELTTLDNILLNVNLSQLTGDVDLYVKQDSVPTRFDYDCRSNNSFQSAEKCLQRLKQGQKHFIAVAAREDSGYRLEAILDEIVVSKVSLLLHGLASEAGTWNKLVDDDSFFSGSCTRLNIADELTELPQANSKGEYCFRLDFGGYDRDSGLATAGLDGKTCITVDGCNGDFSNFNLLGKEVETAIDQIVTALGIDTEVVLLGHSRGGLAARAYLQNSDSLYKEYVKSLVTTGTPHQGSPLGRFYRFMELNCIPQISYQNDSGMCEDNWEVVKMLAGERWYLDYEYIDLRVPSIDFLSPESTEIIELNGNILALENIIIAQLSYRGTNFGILAEDVGLGSDYDLYDYGAWFGGDHPHPSTLRYIENGQTRDSFIGDGIVPAYSQQLSELLIPVARNVDLSFSSTAYNVIHTEQTQQVSDLYSMFESVRVQIGWEQ
ncbi:alpha/beta fold hydrolase [Shewanella frigidimarina]|nr:alpha/beta fold hydrolase [Shewanella frigidimarina]